MGNLTRLLAIATLLVLAVLGLAGPQSCLPSVLPASALIEARMPVALIGASKNAKAINALLVAYNQKVKSVNLDTIVDTAINKDNSAALLKVIKECTKLLYDTKARIANPTRADGTAKTWSKNQVNAIKLITTAIGAEESFLKNLKERAEQVAGDDADGADGGGKGGAASALGGVKLSKDTSPPEWIARLPFFTEDESPKDISALSSAAKDTGKGGGGSTALYTMPWKGKEWKVVAKKDRTATYVDKDEDPDGVGPTEYEFSVYRRIYEAANSGKIDGLAIVYGWAWLNWGQTRLEQMVMKLYPMDGLKVMKILNDYMTNEVISGVDYWNVIAYIADALLTGLNSLHRFGFTHNDMKPDNFMVDAKGRVWVIDLNGASTFEVGPNALTKEYCPEDIFRASAEYAKSDKTTPWAYDGKKLDMFLLGNTLIHMTACPQDIDKADCQPKTKQAAAVDDYDESYKDFIAKLRAANPDDRPTIEAAKAHDFLSEMDAAGARQILVNVVNYEAYIKQWQAEHPDAVYHENIDVKKARPRFLKLLSQLDVKFEHYQRFEKTRAHAYVEIEKFLADLEYRKQRLLGAGVSSSDDVFLKYPPMVKKWEKLAKQYPPPAPNWEPVKKSKIAEEAEQQGKAKGKKGGADDDE